MVEECDRWHWFWRCFNCGFQVDRVMEENRRAAE